ncbi:hypothetical protein LOY67_03620 [Pseudomonas sp. B21-056]|jgi:hypothetical protein|uniref:hypothetical protein n=1 Tax=Pseudomonas sp. B21-056 TaxID=2895495 RepID=UPI002232A3E9|nr:hypothetical protein [Pseudomonas sp. B21-056]UZE24513.1 hypothetical protein LOY67_03620 [Pseudomonas sp. B21-056]
MAISEKESSGSWGDGVAAIIDAIANLYNAVSAMSPGVADILVILVALLPFFGLICRYMGISVREKQSTLRVKDARKATKKGAKKITGGSRT